MIIKQAMITDFDVITEAELLCFPPLAIEYWVVRVPITEEALFTKDSLSGADQSFDGN